jgi:EpsI family protein
MFRTKILPLLALLLTCCALGANAVLESGSLRKLERRDVSVFPKKLGDWEGGEDRPLDPEIQKQLATANVLDRLYTNRQGHVINLLIVSSTDPEDAHSPEACLPSQGWVPEQTKTATIDGQLVHVDQMTKLGEKMDVLFWWDILVDKNANIFSRIEALRESFRGQGAVMVRLTMTSSPTSAAEQETFAKLVMPAMRVWKNTAPVLKEK